MDSVIEKTYFFELEKAKNPNTQILITIISNDLRQIPITSVAIVGLDW